ncbi:MAG: cell division ATP-binding protein FtsE [bacterium]
MSSSRRPENGEMVLQLRGIVYRAPGSQFELKVDQFALPWGSFSLVVGRTGAGKTTLLKLINLLLTPLQGEVIFYRFRTSELSSKERCLWRKRLGWIPQETELLYDRTVLENILLTARCDTAIRESPKRRALQALSQVGLAHKLHRLPQNLSGGERQRVAIARALVNQPFLIVADEPVAHLDSQTSHEIADLLYRINLSGTAVLIATHQPERFSHLNPQIWHMENGRLKET